MNPGAPIAVVKVGGSLLDWAELPARLAAEIATRSDRRLVLIAGGGRLADVLRNLDRVHNLGEPRSHALALRILDATAAILAALLPRSRVVTSVEELLQAWSDGLVPILAPRETLDRDDRLTPTDALPHSWSVTTDSIAARVAELLGAGELVLIKSTDGPSGPDPRAWTDSGLTDAHFPEAASRLLRVTCVNLRGEATPIPRAVARPSR